MSQSNEFSFISLPYLISGQIVQCKPPHLVMPLIFHLGYFPIIGTFDLIMWSLIFRWLLNAVNGGWLKTEARNGSWLDMDRQCLA